MEDYPQTTLTQKRNQIMTGAKKLKRERLDHDDSPSGSNVDKNAIIKVGIWILAVVFIGIAVALLLTNVLNKPVTTSPSNVKPLPESLPVSSAVTPRPLITPIPSITPVVSPVTTPRVATPTPVATVTPVASTGDLESLAVYSTTDRVVSTTNTANNLILNKFNFLQGAAEFNYIFKEVSTNSGEIDPAVKLTYSGNDLTLEIDNVYRDNVTGNGGTTSRTFTNVPGITSSTTSNKANVSKYTFKMNKQYESRVVFNKTAGTITLQIKNR